MFPALVAFIIACCSLSGFVGITHFIVLSATQQISLQK